MVDIFFHCDTPLHRGDLIWSGYPEELSLLVFRAPSVTETGDERKLIDPAHAVQQGRYTAAVYVLLSMTPSNQLLGGQSYNLNKEITKHGKSNLEIFEWRCCNG
jgi:hypothetical protein